MQDLRNSIRHPKNVQIATVDYLPPWTLILIDAKYGAGVVFVELGTFGENPRGRPTLMLRSKRHPEWFGLFEEQFESMWRHARRDTSVSSQ